MRRQARTQLSRRPWRVDTFDALADCWFSRAPEGMDLDAAAAVPPTPFRRVIMFVDNAGECCHEHMARPAACSCMWTMQASIARSLV